MTYFMALRGLGTAGNYSRLGELNGGAGCFVEFVRVVTLVRRVMFVSNLSGETGGRTSRTVNPGLGDQIDETTRMEYRPLSGWSCEPVADPEEFPRLYS
jgi:hypothetical protein